MELTHLCYLDICFCWCDQDVSNNQLLQLPVTINRLRSLHVLNVRNNQLVELPSGMSCKSRLIVKQLSLIITTTATVVMTNTTIFCF